MLQVISCMISPNFAISSSGYRGAGSLYDIIHRIGIPRSVQKGQAIIKEGGYSNFFIYIVQGVFKTVAKVDERPFILSFTFEDDIDCCQGALLSGLPNSVTIEAVVDSEVLICNMQDFESVACKEDHHVIINKLLIYYLGFLERRLLGAISLNAEQAYRLILQEHPEQIKQLPLSHIAGYLGITVERLSRIRKKLSVGEFSS